MSVANQSFSMAVNGAVAPNSSVCGVPPMNQALVDDSLTFALLQAKLYEALYGHISSADIFIDLCVDGQPTWKSIVSLLKPQDAEKHCARHAESDRISEIQFAAFVSSFSSPSA